MTFKQRNQLCAEQEEEAQQRESGARRPREGGGSCMRPKDVRMESLVGRFPVCSEVPLGNPGSTLDS